MRKATAIYHAPEGDNEVVHMGGVRFIDGEAVELNSDDHSHLMSKLDGNQHFELEVGEDDGAKKKKGGRPSNAEKAAAEAERKAAEEQAAADKAAAEKALVVTK